MIYKHPETGESMSKADFYNFMYGEEFMESEDKGKIKFYIKTETFKIINNE